MTAKRFKKDRGTFWDKDKRLNMDETVELLNDLSDENEQLQHYKEAYGTEIIKIKQTIKDMIESERTEIGKMTLRQLWRQIQ